MKDLKFIIQRFFLIRYLWIYGLFVCAICECPKWCCVCLLGCLTCKKFGNECKCDIYNGDEEWVP